MLAAGLILPVLDGLDEIAEEVRGSAISRISDALRPGEQVVIACRTQQYRDAVRPQGRPEVTLRAAAVELRPLDAKAVRRYLCDDAAGPVMRARWDAVLALLGTDAPVGQALRTPLMVSLARMIYNPRPGELAESLRDPAKELCQPNLTDQKAVESLLFDAFIPAAYRHDTDSRWRLRDAERWLVFLAGYLERTIVRPDLAWWQLPLAVPGFALVARIVNGVVLGVTAGVVVRVVAGPVAGPVFGVLVGLVAAVVAGFGFPIDVPTPIRAIRMRRPKRITVLAGGGFGIVVAVAGYAAGGKYGLKVAAGWALLGVLVGIGIVLLSWLFDQTGDPLEPASATSPPAALSADRRSGIILATPGVVVAGVVSGVIAGGVAGLGYGLAVGLVVGILSGALNGFGTAAWPSFEIARISLALRRWLPWPLMGFLADAHRRGILQQAGAFYQFRHIELQHRLANRDASAGSAAKENGSTG